MRAQSCLTLCDPMDWSLPGSSVHGISQARILERVAIPFSRGSSQPGIELVSPTSPTLAGGFFTTEPPGKPFPRVFTFQRVVPNGKMLDSTASWARCSVMT